MKAFKSLSWVAIFGFFAFGGAVMAQQVCPSGGGAARPIQRRRAVIPMRGRSMSCARRLPRLWP